MQVMRLHRMTLVTHLYVALQCPCSCSRRPSNRLDNSCSLHSGIALEYVITHFYAVSIREREKDEALNSQYHSLGNGLCLL